MQHFTMTCGHCGHHETVAECDSDVTLPLEESQAKRMFWDRGWVWIDDTDTNTRCPACTMVHFPTADENANFLDVGVVSITTMGQFVALLVDGNDKAVRFKIVENYPSDENGKFVQRMEIYLVPNGQVKRYAAGCDRIHKLLKAMMVEDVIE